MTTQIYHDICTYLRRLIKDTPYEGHVYAVGGCCRDEVMGNDIKDVDLAVDLPDGGIEFARWLSARQLTSGEPVLFPKFGTAKLYLRDFPDDELQVVQTRREKYTDHNSRNPETAFGSLEEDCIRRDLTINSLYYDITNERLIDITGVGVRHIKEHVLRTPAEPFETFDDDPVRILRCVRFAARFGWKIDKDMLEAMAENACRLNIISRPRLISEFNKLLTGPKPDMALSYLRNIGAICHIFPQLNPLRRLPDDTHHPAPANNTDINQYSVWQHTLDTLYHLEKTENHPWLPLRLAAMLYESGKQPAKMRHSDGTVSYPQYELRSAKVARQMLRALHYDSPIVRRTLFLITHHRYAVTWGEHAEHMTDRDLRRLQLASGNYEMFEALLDLIDAFNHASGTCLDQVRYIRQRNQKMIENNDHMFNFELPVSADDIMRIKGTHSQKFVHRAKQHLIKMATQNPQRNDYDRLIRRFR